MLKIRNMMALMALSLMIMACSAKDAEAKTVANAAQPDTAVKAAAATQTRPSPSEQFALIFEKQGNAIKQALATNPKNYQDKVHFDTYETPLAKVSPEPGKIEVVEFFSYGCGACFSAEPTMHALDESLGDDVNFVRVPAPFNPYFEHLARAYYTAQALGASADAHNALFQEIHLNKNRLTTVNDLAAFYAKYGVDKDKFVKTFDSFSVNTNLNRARDLVGKYQIGSVPNIVVNGKYLSIGQKAGSYDAWAQIIDQLVDEERKLTDR